MVNLDTGTAFAFVLEGSLVRHQLKAFVAGRPMVMTQTAYNEFTNIVRTFGGPLEQARASKLLQKITIIPDNPSARAVALVRTRNVKDNDIIIFGTGDTLGITTMTSDLAFSRAANAQGVYFDVYEHAPKRLTGI